MNDNVASRSTSPKVGKSKSRTRRWFFLSLLLLIAAGIILFVTWPHSPTSNPSPSTEDDFDFDQLLVVKNPGYVGPEVCGSCHPSRLEEFKNTRHYRAMWTPEVGTMPPGFDSIKGSYQTRNPNVRFEMTQSGKDFFQATIRKTFEGEKRFSNRIDFVYGAHGRADEVFFTWKGDQLFELPLGWLHPNNHWGEQNYDPSHPTDFTRTTTPRCLECHNTWFEHIPGTENQYRKDHCILGTTCEKCHGPAKDHVQYHQNHPDEKKPQSIIQPGHLHRDRLMDVCGQCHSNAPDRRGPAFSYRPGEPLEKYFRTMVSNDLEHDHVANQDGYLRQSKCFQKSEMICIDCHNPHRTTNLTIVEKVCQKCHQLNHCREQEKLPVELREQCVECHMPRYNRVAVYFQTNDDHYVFPVRPRNHQIGIYPEAKQEVLLRWYQSGPKEENQSKIMELRNSLTQHWLSEGQKREQNHFLLSSIGAYREAVRFDPSDKSKWKLDEAMERKSKLDRLLFEAQNDFNQKKIEEAISKYQAALQINPVHVQAHEKLGTLYAIKGQKSEAIKYLQAASQLDPDDFYSPNMLGWLAYLEGNASAAIPSFQKADEIHPFDAEIHYRWGLALLRLERWEDAEIQFEKVLQIQPKHAGGYQGLSHALRKLHRLEESILQALRATRLSESQNPDILLTLADAYAEAGRLEDAIQTTDQVLKIAQSNDLQLEVMIRKRLQEWKKQGESLKK